jgi:predicted outer membrane repeat protein
MFMTLRRSHRHSRRRRRLLVESLELRRVLAAFVVNTWQDVVDAGDSLTSLREAVAVANATPGRDTVSFDRAAFSQPAVTHLSLGQLEITDSLTIEGPGRELLSIDAQGLSRVMQFIGTQGDLSLSGLTITGGSTAEGEPGGGIHFQPLAGTLTLSGMTVAANTSAAGGGGIFSSGDTFIEQSEISSNHAADGGGGIASTQSIRIVGTTVTGNTSGSDGGGIHALTDDSMAVSVSMSSVSLNTVSSDGSRGGGIFASGDTLLTDSTISGNQLLGAGADGGGLYVAAGVVELHSSTVAQNVATRAGGGILVPFNHESPLILRNSILAQNSDSGFAPNFRGILDLNMLMVDFSLIDDNTGTTLPESQTPSFHGNLVGRPLPAGSGVIDAGLDSLTVIGGAQVHPLIAQSPAIDSGDEAVPPANDQRGTPFVRVSGQSIDRGAFERQPPVEPIIDWNDPASIPVGAALDALQLSATAQTPGTFTYTPPPGTILGVGDDQTLSVVFTPNDTEYFLPTTASVMVDVRPLLDFGDAPDSYATFLSSDGPRHQESSLRLGDAIDFEIDGQPHPQAGGDTLGDDGVSLITSLVADPNQSTTSTLSIDASAASMLDAWIDFNANGVFDHPSEHIADGASIRLARGSNVVPVVVPAGAMAGTTFARFRVSTDGGLLPTGVAVDGEVEDHELTILSGEISPQIDVVLPRGGATVSTQSGERFIIQRGRTLFRAPAAAVGRFDITGTEFSDVLVIDASQGAAVPAGGMSFDGGDRVNTVRVIGPQLLDTSAESNVSINNVDVIDLTDAAAQTVIVDVASAHRIDPTGGGLILTGDGNDQITFADPEGWRMNDPVNIAGFSFSKVVTMSTFIQVDFGSPWQNLAQPSDVSNDGAVTAVDALRIINELGRRLFSDSGTAHLNAPSDSFTWPNSYFDQNGDGKATALDALRVINQLSRITNASAAIAGELVSRPVIAPATADPSSMMRDDQVFRFTQDGDTPVISVAQGQSRRPIDEYDAQPGRHRERTPHSEIADASKLRHSSVDSLLSQHDFLSSDLSDLGSD